MASLFIDSRSKFWYLKYKCPQTGKWKSRATPYRHEVAADTRKARLLEAETTASEKVAPQRTPAWDDWVTSFMEAHYVKETTRKSAFCYWQHFRAFFAERNVWHPALLKREHAYDYIEWRSNPKNAKKENGKVIRKVGSRNSALTELRYLGVIVNEAVNRDYIPKNPIARLRIKPQKSKEKEPLTDDEIARILAECERQDAESAAIEKPWRALAFKIALCHGVRISEAKIPMEDVHLEIGTIAFDKNKTDRPYGVPIHPDLLPDLQRLKEKGAKFTVELPENAATRFWYLFRKIGIEKSIHCTRVTVATRLAIAGVDERKARLFLNHSSSLVHRIYVKMRPEHILDVTKALSFPSSGPGSETSA